VDMRSGNILLYVSLESSRGHTSDLAWMTRCAPFRNLDATWDDWVSIVSSVDLESSSGLTV
jgi:hypothetical protein